jgi:predicted amino acid-binding ACT domain protein
MAYTIRKVEVWAGDFLNRPGMLARVLEALTQAGAQLELVIGRQVTEKTSRIFVAPLTGRKQKHAANEVGLVPAVGMHALRIEGPDRMGLGAELSRAVADAGVNIRGVTGATIGRKMVFYLGFRTADQTQRAATALRKLLRARKSRR